MTKSIVLCSGGLNSAVLLALAKEAGPLTMVHARFERPAARREADLAARLAGHYKISDSLVLELPHVAALRAQSATTDVSVPPPVSRIAADAPLPGILTTLVGVAATAAAASGATRVWFGLSESPVRTGDETQTDPTQAREFVQLMECALALTAQTPITLESPLISMSRGEIVALACRMEVPLKLTWSCWTSGDVPCQTCPGCRFRARGFLDATTPDPILTRAVTPSAPQSAAAQPAAV